MNADKIIIGTTNLDTLISFPFPLFFTSYAPPTDEREFNGYLEQYILNETQQDLIKNTYYPLSDFPELTYNGSAASNGPMTFSSYTMRWYTINADCCFICGALWYAKKLTENNNTKGLYVYNFIGPQTTDYLMHGGDLPYIFSNRSGEYAAWFDLYDLPEDPELSSLFQDLWINFAQYGVPNSSSNIFTEEWIPYDDDDATGSAYMLGSDGTNGYYNLKDYISNGHRNGVCDFWIGDIGWDRLGSLCLNALSLSPTTAPTMNPTINPTTGQAKGEDEEDDATTTWMIVAIIFIVLFAIALGALLYYCYTIRQNENTTISSEHSHKKVASEDGAEMATATKGKGGSTEDDNLL